VVTERSRGGVRRESEKRSPAPDGREAYEVNSGSRIRPGFLSRLAAWPPRTRRRWRFRSGRCP
jgi:hypothetical protein